MFVANKKKYVYKSKLIVNTAKMRLRLQKSNYAELENDVKF